MITGCGGQVGKQTFYQLNYTRTVHGQVYRLLKQLPSSIGTVIALCLLFVLAVPAHAEETTPPTLLKTISFGATTFERGFSYSDPTGQFHLIVQGKTFSAPATIAISTLDESSLPEQSGWSRDSDAFEVTVATSDGSPLRLPLLFEGSISVPGYVSSLRKLDASGAWEELGSSITPDGEWIRSADDKLTFTVASFYQPGKQIGIATYYGTYTRKTKKTMVAASNVFPYGQDVRVTNLENGKTVTVTVVDTGSFKLPRVIDLSTPAFAKIQPTWKGLARVRVEKATPWNAPPTMQGSDENVSESAPTLDGTKPPASPAAAYILTDGATGQKLLGKNEETAMPIASLSKLVTAAVFMDTRPDLNTVVVYNSDDNAICSCLKLANGERVKLKDLLYGSLVGSANNATLALVRATGLTRAQFVQRMNEKAQNLGMTETSFVEPTGLDSGNVSSPADLAIALKRVPDSSSTIRKMLSTGSYSFISQNTTCLAAFRQKNDTCKHSFVTTNKLLGKTSYAIVAAKTGYIDEARHTFAVRGRDASGHELIFVSLKVYQKADSFTAANAILNWAFAHAQWKSTGALS